MWPFLRKKNDLVVITINPKYITCSWIVPIKNYPKLRLNAYRKIPINPLLVHQLIICNPTKLKKIIKTFLQQHQLTNAKISLAVNGPGVFQKIVACNSSKPSINIPELKKMVWHTIYLYPAENGQFCFYICGMAKELVFQYGLFATSIDINLVSIIPQFMSPIYLFRHIQGQSFRHATLGMALTSQPNLEDKLSAHIIARMLCIKPSLNITIQMELPFLRCALGSYLSERPIT